MYGYIYKCTYLKNNKIYIGAKSSPTFIKIYYGSGSLWNKEVVSKCNPEMDIKREVLEWCDTYEQLNQQEQYWIKYYDSTNPEIGYNIQKGGNLPSEESRNRMSIIIHNSMTEERKQKISKGLKKQRQETGLSDSHKKHLSEALKGKNIGSDGDTRSIPVYCIINNKKFYFSSKILAARWWYNNYPFSDNYVEITYTRMITKSINNEKLYYNKKLINQPIKWYLDKTLQIIERNPVYCIYEGKRYDFKNTDEAAEWWFETYPFPGSYNRLRYIYRITASINGRIPEYKGHIRNKIQWFRKE